MFNQLNFSMPSVDINITYLVKKVNTRAPLWGPFGFKLNYVSKTIVKGTGSKEPISSFLYVEQKKITHNFYMDMVSLTFK